MTNPSWSPDLAGRPGARYRAIADALADDIAAGRVAPGTRLPTHRDLAYALKVTVGTVTRAYAEAERRGLIAGEVGRGTYVKAARPAAAETWPNVQAAPAATNDLVNLSVCQPGAAGVAGALPALLRELQKSPALLEPLLAYTAHGGLPDHRAAGAEWLNRQHGLDATPESVLITCGAQNGLAVACATLARPGDVILTERLTYFGLKAAVGTLGMRLEGVPIDEDGLLPDAFEAACRQSAPRMLAVVPTLHNPTTAVLPLERRHAIAAIARRHGVMILEDDVFGFLMPSAPPPFQRIAPDITVHVNSLSKSVAAGLRIGYLVAPPGLVPRLESAIRALTYVAPALMAEIASRWIRDGSADGFARQQREEAAARQRIAREILGDDPAVVAPSAGQHLWLKLPEPWRREEFVAEALRRGVAVTGADAFMVGRAAAPHAVRISLCMPAHREDLRRGLRTLAETLASPVTAGLSIV